MQWNPPSPTWVVVTLRLGPHLARASGAPVLLRSPLTVAPLRARPSRPPDEHLARPLRGTEANHSEPTCTNLGCTLAPAGRKPPAGASGAAVPTIGLPVTVASL
jgi:hypothetical protein